MVTGCRIAMKSCHICIRQLKVLLVNYEKYGTLSINIGSTAILRTSWSPMTSFTLNRVTTLSVQMPFGVYGKKARFLKCNFISQVASTNADFALLNSGTLRSDQIHPAGPFFVKDIVSILPMIDPLVLVEINGKLKTFFQWYFS